VGKAPGFFFVIKNEKQAPGAGHFVDEVNIAEMSILLTGGAGYIGSHTAVELIAGGHGVVIADNYSNSSPEVIRRIETITGVLPRVYNMDVTQADSMRTLFSENDIDAVIHFAGYKAVGESVSLPLKYYRNNLDATFTLLEIMGEYGVKKLVFSSSATVYGVSERLPLTEDMPTSATNPYGQTKLMIEQMLRDISAASPDWSITLLRYFNPVGAHKSGLIGEAPNGIPNNLMPYIAKVAAGKLDRLHVFGDDYPTKDGTGERDYIHVVDLALGHVAALDYIGKHTGLSVFNLGTGKPNSVLEMVHAFQNASQTIIPYVIDPRRPGDVAACYADPGKALRELGWSARRTLRNMCEDTWRWQQGNPNGYQSAAEEEETDNV
jgi:UDP-glucose 4-epimerase